MLLDRLRSVVGVAHALGESRQKAAAANRANVLRFMRFSMRSSGNGSWHATAWPPFRVSAIAAIMR